jgi:hypothetical protein
VTSPKKPFRSFPVFAATLCRPFTIATEGSSGVEGVLIIMLSPFSSTQMRSVNVPPVSMPITYFILTLLSVGLKCYPKSYLLWPLWDEVNISIESIHEPQFD